MTSRVVFRLGGRASWLSPSFFLTQRVKPCRRPEWRISEPQRRQGEYDGGDGSPRSLRKGCYHGRNKPLICNTCVANMEPQSHSCKLF